MSGSCGELIISPEELACIQAACQRRAAELAREAATAALQVDTIAAESPQSAPAALPAPSLVPLASAFWQALLYGSCNALVSSMDANTALRLVAFELGKDSDVVRFSDSVRVNTLRKMLDQQFGAKVWDVMDMLLRAAPPSPGAPTPNEDQSHCSSEYRTVRAPCRPGAGIPSRGR